MKTSSKVVLVILDGWGHRLEKKGNAISQAFTPHYSRYLGEYPNGLINASGYHVGLPDHVMGNSEVGHMNIGAGRLIMQDQVRINQSIEDESFFSNPLLKNLSQKLKSTEKKIHLVGLVSNGNVHSSESHYLALLDFFHRENIPGERIIFHAILDGRDTAPKSAKGFLNHLEEGLNRFGGKLGSISGRFYAMDRDQRWERTDLAYQAMVLGQGKKFATATLALADAYESGETDEFVTPRVIIDASSISQGTMDSGDMVLCFNYRADRMRQICRAMLFPNTPIPSLDKSLRLNVFSLTVYDKAFPVPVVFKPESYEMTLGEVVDIRGLYQFRTAETEKYAHVTFFFSCGHESPFEHEDRCLIPSPKVRTYDLVPAMNSALVTDGVVQRIITEKYHLIVVNYAQPDMVGHTGNFDAAIAAVEA
ncbi:MAG: 2,3-bisphosphoglycerate-independent phosphoglycerate mutase, partial [Bdellovibrionales bacterium]|nr:2,3-bisphosphoglycerate-independent phosphoglycerate mutase [Bdellovibrionales bacterium]